MKNELKQHIRVAAASLARGHLSLEQVTNVLEGMVREAGNRDLAATWLGRDRLSPEQLAAILEERTTDRIEETAGATRGYGAPVEVITDNDTEPVQAPEIRERGVAAPPTDRYEVVRLIAVGGSGRVIECHDPILDRRVALKTCRRELDGFAGNEAVLQREAEIASALEHPNIIPVYDAGTAPNLGRFYVMRLVDQPSLEEILAGLREGDPSQKKEYSLGRLLRTFIQVCRAVDYAHSRGVIHCDLKPANILIGEFGEVLLVDWGLAYRVEDASGFRGGTPGYMAPEQLDPGVLDFDPRTDVYALGAILYEILCHQPAFPGSDVKSILGKARPKDGRPILDRPGERAPDLDIPPELEQICLRALRHDPRERYASAGEIASAIESFLDHAQDQERRRQQAELLADEGDDLAARYHEFLESRADQVHKLHELNNRIAPWDPLEVKRKLWNTEDHMLVTDALRVRTMQAAIAAYEQALELMPSQRRARRGLANIYWSEWRRAQERRHQLDQLYFEGLVRRYDDGQLLASVAPEGVLTVEMTAPATLRLDSLKERDRRMSASGKPRLICEPSTRLALEAGSYALTLESDGHEVTHPLLIRPGESQVVRVDPSVAATLEDDEVYVPGGAALLGGDDQELLRVEVPAFIVARYPVTFADYLEFVAECIQKDAAAAEPYIPRSRSGATYWVWNDGRWEPGDLPGYVEAPASDPASRASIEELLELPAFGVDVISAQAYAAWLSRRRGHTYRLLGEDEWEKAARGCDGRHFPWGDHFDASFCKIRESRPGDPRPEPAARFPYDRSPYGVVAMAGTIAEWTVGGSGEQAGGPRYFSRGGAWCDWAADCRLSLRRPYSAEERSARLGFRLARDPG